VCYNQRLVAILAGGNLQDAQVGVGLSVRSANGVVLSGAVLGALRSNLALAFMGHDQGVVVCLACGHPQDTLVWVGFAVSSTDGLVHPVASLRAVAGLNRGALASVCYNQRLVAILAGGNLQDAQVGVGLSVRSANGVVLSGAVLGALRSDLALAFMGHDQGIVICLACSHPQDTLVWVGLTVSSTDGLVHPVASLWAVAGLNRGALASVCHNQRLIAILAGGNLQDAQVGVGLSVRSANWVVLSGAVLGTRCSNLAFTLMCHDQ